MRLETNPVSVILMYFDKKIGPIKFENISLSFSFFFFFSFFIFYMLMKSILIAVTVLIQSTLASYFVSDDVLNLPRYKVSLLTTEKIPQSQLHDATFNDQTMLMRDSYGQPFLCNIPQVDRDEAEHQEQMEAETKDTHEDEQKLIERGLELLQPLENSCLQFYVTIETGQKERHTINLSQ